MREVRTDGFGAGLVSGVVGGGFDRASGRRKTEMVRGRLVRKAHGLIAVLLDGRAVGVGGVLLVHGTVVRVVVLGLLRGDEHVA